MLHLTQALRAHEITSLVAVGRDGPAASRLREAGVPVVVLGPMGVGAPRSVARIAARVPHDVLHLHGSRAGLAGTLASRLRLLDRLHPIVYTAHAFSFRRGAPRVFRWAFARTERFTCSTAGAVICLTHADVRAAQQAGVTARRFVVIPNGLDASRFRAAADRRDEFGIPRGAPVAGLIARLVPQKDPLRFVEVADAVSRAVPEARFLLVGDGPLRGAVEAAVRDRGLDGRVTLTGFRADVPELLATMDVFVLTSAWEGLPFAVLEAMAAQRPVIVSDLPGIDEVLEHGRTGLIVNGREPLAIALAVQGLLRDPARRREMGQAGRARVEQRFTIARMAEDTAAVYDDV